MRSGSGGAAKFWEAVHRADSGLRADRASRQLPGARAGARSCLLARAAGLLASLPNPAGEEHEATHCFDKCDLRYAFRQASGEASPLLPTRQERSPRLALLADQASRIELGGHRLARVQAL